VAGGLAAQPFFVHLTPGGAEPGRLRVRNSKEGKQLNPQDPTSSSTGDWPASSMNLFVFFVV
jgi:hypothetical protein